MPPPPIGKGLHNCDTKIWGAKAAPYPHNSDSPVLLRLHNIALPIIESDANRSATSCIVQCQLFEKVKNEANVFMKSQFLYYIKCMACIIKIFSRLLWALQCTLKCVAILPTWYNFSDLAI